MWIALQVILGHLWLLPIFWPKKPKFLKQRKNRLEISSLYPKDHNHLMPTASQVILGQFLPFYSIFGPKLKISKIEKNAWNVLKLLKNGNHITCCSSGRMQASFLQIVSHFCSFTPFLPTKKQIFEKWKKKNAYRYYHFTYS